MTPSDIPPSGSAPDLPTLLATALAMHDQNQLDPAEKLYQTILALDPGHFTSLHQLGVIRNQAGRFEEAYRYFAAALNLNPRSALAHLNIGISCWNLHRVEEALSHYEYSLAIKPGNPDAVMYRALALYELGRIDEAKGFLTQALDLRPEVLPQALIAAHNDLVMDASNQQKQGWLGGLLRGCQDLPGLFARVKDDLLPFHPPYLEIETINVCNAACVMCPASDKSRQAKVMSMALYKKIIDEIAAYPIPPTISLHGIGEPMLDRFLTERIAYARNQGLSRVSFVSNGALLTEEKARAVLEAGVFGISVSIESIDPTLYADIRVNLHLEEVVRNVSQLARLRDAINPELSISIVRVLVSEDEAEAVAFESFWRTRLRPGLDKILSFPRHNFAMGYASDFTPGSMPCSKPFEAMNIRSDGTVPLCCVDNSNTYSFGNAENVSVLALYNADPFQLIRWQHLAGSRPDLALCGQCNVPEAGEPSISVTL